MALDVEVIAVDLDVPASSVARFGRLLPATERDTGPRATVLRAMTREVLADTLGTPPAAVAITRRCEHCGHESHGRPRLVDDTQMSFSVSHSGTVGVIALARGDGVAVGVDLERVRPRRDLAKLAARTLGPAQLAAWRATPLTEQLTEFLRVWTAKEAYVKAIGTGLTTRLVDVEPPDAWSVRPLAAPWGYVGSLVVGPVSRSGGTGG